MPPLTLRDAAMPRRTRRHGRRSPTTAAAWPPHSTAVLLQDLRVTDVRWAVIYDGVRRPFPRCLSPARPCRVAHGGMAAVRQLQRRHGRRTPARLLLQDLGVDGTPLLVRAGQIAGAHQERRRDLAAGEDERFLEQLHPLVFRARMMRIEPFRK